MRRRSASGSVLTTGAAASACFGLMARSAAFCASVNARFVALDSTKVMRSSADFFPASMGVRH
ncbi:hypothetical protein D3C79_1070420 [compost metagenome]